LRSKEGTLKPAKFVELKEIVATSAVDGDNAGYALCTEDEEKDRIEDYISRECASGKSGTYALNHGDLEEGATRSKRKAMYVSDEFASCPHIDCPVFFQNKCRKPETRQARWQDHQDEFHNSSGHAPVSTPDGHKDSRVLQQLEQVQQEHEALIATLKKTKKVSDKAADKAAAAVKAAAAETKAAVKGKKKAEKAQKTAEAQLELTTKRQAAAEAKLNSKKQKTADTTAVPAFVLDALQSAQLASYRAAIAQKEENARRDQREQSTLLIVANLATQLSGKGELQLNLPNTKTPAWANMKISSWEKGHVFNFMREKLELFDASDAMLTEKLNGRDLVAYMEDGVFDVNGFLEEFSQVAPDNTRPD
jgi:hypothetical protein